MKRLVCIFLTVALLITIMNISAADSKIVEGMEFRTDKIAITLYQAVEKVIKDNSSIKNAMFEIEQAKISSEKLSDARRKISKKVNITVGSTYDYEIRARDLASNYLLSNSSNNLEAVKNIVKGEVEQTYYGLLLAKETYEINKKNVEIAKDLLDKTNKKYNLGLVARQEVIDSELNYIKANSQLTASENQLKSAKMSFNIKLAYNVMDNTEPVGSLSFSEQKVDDLVNVIKSALQSRNEIKSMQYSLDYAKMKMEIIKGSKPEITYDYRAQALSLEKAQKDYEDMVKTIEMDVRNKYMAIISKLDSIKSGKKAVELAEESLKISTLSYEKGMAVLTDVQKAQNGLLQARLGLSQSILDYNLAVSEYKDSAGIGRTAIPAAVAGDLYTLPTELLY